VNDRAEYGSPRVTTGLVVFVAALVALAPLPFGSVRPLAWSACVAATGLALVLFILAGGRRVSRPPGWMMGLGALLLLALVCQVLPIGRIWPLTFDLGGNEIVSDSLSLNPGATALMILRLAGYGLFLMIVLTISANPRRATTLLHIGFGVTVIYAGLGLLMLVHGGDTILGVQKWVYQGFATGPFVNHNSFAAFLAMGLSAGLASLFAVLASELPKSGKFAYSAMIVLCLAVVGTALLATVSRMGVATALAGAVVATLIGLTRLGHRAVGMIVLAALLGGGILLAVGAGDDLLARTFGIDISLDSRWALYSQVWDAILQRPLLGYGGGSFYWSFAPFAHPPLLGDVEWTKAHSTVLQWWFELGLVAGSVPLLLYGGTLFSLIRRAFQRESWYLNLAAIGALVAAGLHSLIDFQLEIPANAYFAILLIGIGLSGRRAGPQA